VQGLPTVRFQDRVKKPRRYGDFGIPEYCVRDPQESCVLTWRFADGATEPVRLTGLFEWRPPGAAEALTLDITELLRTP
jgi:hypothetical protein